MIEMMLDRKGTILMRSGWLLSTGIVELLHGSLNWENGRYSAVGRRIETLLPFMNMKYHSTHGPLFETGPHCRQNTPYIRGFES